MKILLVEDDEALVSLLTQSLAAHHFVVDVVQDGELGWIYGSTFEYDLLVLDVMLPKLDGISLCQRFRAEGYTTPILLLTAQDASTTKVQGLEAGADDYVVKPFDLAELIARIRALLRRKSSHSSSWLIWENLQLNSSTCEVMYQEQPLSLTTKEFELLELLLRDRQHVFSADEILDRLWSSEEFPSEATVRSHLRRLRQKLTAAGAPPDLIATLHGRGYYLKAPLSHESESKDTNSQEVNSPTSSSHTGATGATLAVMSSGDRNARVQQQYLTFLNTTWKTTQPKSLAQVALLTQAITDLQAEHLTSLQQAQAHQIAHKLAGTLGTFGLLRAMQIARQLEHWFGSSKLRSHQAALMHTLIAALQQEIQTTTSIQSSQLPNRHSPLLLIVNPDVSIAASLVNAAESHGLRTAIAPTLTAAAAWLTPETIPDPSGQVPTAILLQLPAPSASTRTRRKHVSTKMTEVFNLLEQFAQQYPNLPILVSGDSGELSDRLEVIRRGGKLFLDSSVLPEQAIASIVELVGGAKTPIRLLIVDDDQVWLQTLPTLLKPWGFEVTTLDDPHQFWQVLQAVTPDVLVLDIKMPQINGFELCQILRSDPRWQRLPVLFLSVLTDAKSQSEAFTVGADDYLCKPVLGIDLANRILSRLRRIRAWAS
jgi:DNA-binding response OmpR family regulator/HPt (histidine-containing phosphotransfer) domain-containing protein